MSYDLRLVHPVTKEPLHVEQPHSMTGGTYVLGGTTELWLNVTYNYSEDFRKVIDSERGIRKLHGMTGAESVKLLKNATKQLGDDVDEDYWKPTQGNAKHALLQLLAMAQLRPDGVWDVD